MPDTIKPEPITLGASSLPLLPMALGGSWYAKDTGDEDILDAMAASYEGGIRHFDTATGYGAGRSETLLGRFLADKRDSVFLASKTHSNDLSREAMRAQVEGSLQRLATDRIDLYYIHWPRTGQDMRPQMEALEQARQEGKIGAIGVSNFNVEQMQQVAEVAPIAVHQLGYNLLWRAREADVIPWCAANGIKVIAYSALAHGILTGKFARTPELAPGDQRHGILPFRADIWPYVYDGVEQLKQLAAANGLPLASLAVRWILAQPAIDAVVVGARNRVQATANIAALQPAIPAETFARMSEISAAIATHVPDDGNLFGFHP